MPSRSTVLLPLLAAVVAHPVFATTSEAYQAGYRAGQIFGRLVCVALVVAGIAWLIAKLRRDKRK